MIIAVDFDGTCVTHEYPEIGKEIGAVPVLKKLLEKQHQLILWTMRSGKCLERAIGWFEENEIELFGANENPLQDSWTTSPKAYAELYIDDMAMGAPLMADELSERPYINWRRVEGILRLRGVISED